MEEKRAARSVKTTLVVLGLLLSVVVIIALWRYALVGTPEQEATSSSTSSQDTSAASSDSTDATASADDPDTPVSSPPSDDAFGSITIDALEITVYYTKGIGAFEYVISRTSSGTQYVQFTSSSLVGTKCTDDTGEFAVIIENPSEAERQTLQATTTVGTTEYGLSLTGGTCTADEQLLEQYQAAFKNGFSSLRAVQ